MLNSSFLDNDPMCIRDLSDEQLSELVAVLDENEGHKNHKEFLKEFNSECNRRAADAQEGFAGGEWI